VRPEVNNFYTVLGGKEGPQAFLSSFTVHKTYALTWFAEKRISFNRLSMGR